MDQLPGLCRPFDAIFMYREGKNPQTRNNLSLGVLPVAVGGAQPAPVLALEQ